MDKVSIFSTTRLSTHITVLFVLRSLTKTTETLEPYEFESGDMANTSMTIVAIRRDCKKLKPEEISLVSFAAHAISMGVLHNEKRGV